MLSALDCRWLNHPARVSDAEFKPAQLQVAQRVGLATPRTIITNQWREAQRFGRLVDGPVIFKTLQGLSVERHGEELVVYTNLVDDEVLTDESIGATATMFQEWIPKAYEIRATVVGDRCFAARIDAGSPESRIDFRTDYGALDYRVAELPCDVQDRLRSYLGRFGLGFGAFDLVVTPDDEHVFLERNPNGQWGWLEEETGLPIAAAMADYLLGA